MKLPASFTVSFDPQPLPTGWYARRNNDGSLGLYGPLRGPGGVFRRCSHPLYPQDTGDLAEIVRHLLEDAIAQPYVPDTRDQQIADLMKLVAEAPAYFHPLYDFEGRKLAWLMRAGLVPKPEKPTEGPDAGNFVWDDAALNWIRTK